MSQIQGITSIVNSNWMLKRSEERKPQKAGFWVTAAKRWRLRQPDDRCKPVNHTVRY